VKYRAFGGTGLTVSELGLGSWQLGNQRDWGANGPDEAESLAIVAAALDAGVTFFDTAPGYAGGHSERLLGRGLRGHRDEVVLCTKFGHNPDGPDFSPQAVRGSVERSLRQLQTDVIDVLLMHSPPKELFDGRTAPHYETFESLKQEGLIRAYGASVDFPDEVDTVMATTRSRALEVYLSVFHQETWEAVERAGAAGAGGIVKVALESGWLAGRYDASTTFSDVRARWSPDEVRRRAALTGRFLELVPQGWTPVQTALRFVLANSGVATVIPGSKSTAQLKANLEAADADLPTDVQAALRALFAEELAGDPLPW
jgi:aryl-alcohol dehydrogenase-like predicted oxidoreductase